MPVHLGRLAVKEVIVLFSERRNTGAYVTLIVRSVERQDSRTMPADIVRLCAITKQRQDATWVVRIEED